MATIHAEVPNDVNLETAHETIDRIERDVLRELGIFLVIHMDPIEMNDHKIIERKGVVIRVIKELEPQAAIHDFRIVNGEEHINLIFDLVVPFSYNEQQEQELLLRIEEALRKIDERYQVVITVENSFIAE
jgi:divalent metal cation (Fe/Co/Zn/Cd) transporter